jgi:hypothetical protein
MGVIRGHQNQRRAPATVQGGAVRAAGTDTILQRADSLINRRGQPYGGMKSSLRWKLIPHWSNGELQTTTTHFGQFLPPAYPMPLSITASWLGCPRDRAR